MDLLLYIAVAPAALLLRYVFRKDRLEKEPTKLLWKLVGFGALCAVPAVVLELVGEVALLFARTEGTLLHILAMNMLVVPLAEEGSKYCMLKKLTWKHEAFNCTYDGLLYAVYVSLGFAIIENILYIFTGGGMITGLVRAVTAIPGHCFFGVFMGTYYARAKAAEADGDVSLSRKLRLQGLGIAMLVHGLYDLLLSLEEIAALLLFFVLLAGMYYFGIRLVRQASEADRYLDLYLYLYTCPESHPAQTWVCPACGTENDGVICTFCDWQVPKSGKTEAPRQPDEPDDFQYVSLPKHNVKLPLARRLSPLLAMLGFIALSIILLQYGLDRWAPRAVTETMMVLACISFMLALVSPAVLLVRMNKRWDAIDPEYQAAMEEYRADVRRRQQVRADYDAVMEEVREFKEAVERAEKKRKKLEKSGVN